MRRPLIWDAAAPSTCRCRVPPPGCRANPNPPTRRPPLTHAEGKVMLSSFADVARNCLESWCGDGLLRLRGRQARLCGGRTTACRPERASTAPRRRRPHPGEAVAEVAGRCRVERSALGVSFVRRRPREDRSGGREGVAVKLEQVVRGGDVAIVWIKGPSRVRVYACETDACDSPAISTPPLARSARAVCWGW
jgi:hypothetical protein